nr:MULTISPECIES: YqaE/Pmp3 family membrane protein [unclassified Novosphingobium]
MPIACRRPSALHRQGIARRRRLPIFNRLATEIPENAVLYLVAILFPPLALLLVGKPFQAVLNLFLCLLFWIPGVVHALFVVHSAKADARTQRIVTELRRR